MLDREADNPRVAVIDSPARDSFMLTRSLVGSRSVLPWAEHCTECALPDCYATCEFYAPRPDLKCRRITGGIRPERLAGDESTELIRVAFKKWGKLEARGWASAVPRKGADLLEGVDRAVTNALHALPLPFVGRTVATRKWGAFKSRLGTLPKGRRPTHFLIEVFNEDAQPHAVGLVIRHADKAVNSQFQQRLEAAAGYSRWVLAADTIARRVDLAQELVIELAPADHDEVFCLSFGLIDFVVLDEADAARLVARPTSSGPKPESAATGPKVKCVVWDLDNTLWQGTLVEDGLENLVLNPEAVAFIRRFDQQGILQSVASKNTAEDALAALKHFELDQYFLYPQISWNPKSNALAHIAKSLNIGLDTFIFVDDQPFERAEVGAVHETVTCVDPTDLDALTTGPRFDLPVTEESTRRRLMYREEEQRTVAQEGAGSDYIEFLKGCDLTVKLSRIDDSNIERVHELTQRTNQMNFSGNRYSRRRIEEIAADPKLEAHVIACSDRFGDYGIIGFAVVDVAEATMIDLMFSCRIQHKWVDVSFLRHVMQTYRDRGVDAFYAVYKPSKKNGPNSRVFWELQFAATSDVDGVQLLHRALADLPDDFGIVAIEEAS